MFSNRNLNFKFSFVELRSETEAKIVYSRDAREGWRDVSRFPQSKQRQAGSKLGNNKQNSGTSN